MTAKSGGASTAWKEGNDIIKDVHDCTLQSAQLQAFLPEWHNLNGKRANGANRGNEAWASMSCVRGEAAGLCVEFLFESPVLHRGECCKFTVFRFDGVSPESIASIEPRIVMRL